MGNEVLIHEYEEKLQQLKWQMENYEEKIYQKREEVKEQEVIYEKAKNVFREITSSIDIEKIKISRLKSNFPKTRFTSFAGKHLENALQGKRKAMENALEYDIKQKKKEILALYETLDGYVFEKKETEAKLIYYENELMRLRSGI